MIFHSVFFKLKHPKGSLEEIQFLAAAQKLAKLAGVRNFQVLRETSPKNNFDYGLIMEFDNQDQYDGYANHQDHTDFIQQFWIKDVAEFQEIDYEHLKE